MRTRRAAPLVLAALAAGCGNPVHSHYGVKGTAACLRKLVYKVNTNAPKLGKGSATWQLEQCQRVAARLGHDPITQPLIERTGHHAR